jgi:glycine hydroxymethyltransferase
MIKDQDPEIYSAIKMEQERQEANIELIASENYVSKNVLEAAGSVLTNKYAEGLPGARYYGGCQNVDIVEEIAIERAKKLFNAEHANVQPHSGAQANLAVFFALLKPGDKIMGMDLSCGGHLTHGSKANISGKWFEIVSYGVDKDTGLINYKELEEIALRERPKLIVAGASAYPRTIDFEIISKIAKKCDAYFMVDMAHIAGLVAAGLHPSPFPFADVVTTTTHKTLRGPRGGIILCKEEFKNKIDKAVFPGIQGGPLMHIIAAKAVAFGEALADDFKDYQNQVIKNAALLALELKKRDINIVTGGTDNHLLILDLSSRNVTGKELEEALDEVNITTNKNMVPNDPNPPQLTSGIRLGTPAVTTRGFKEEEMIKIASWISEVSNNIGNEEVYKKVKKEVAQLVAKFPMEVL